MKQWTLFDPDNTIYRLLYWVECQLVLNVMFIITCIPWVTIGTSICALYEIQFKLLKNEEVNLIKDYWEAFHRSLKTTILPWLYFILFCFVSYLWFVGFGNDYWQFPIVVEIGVYFIVFTAFVVFSFFCPLKAFYKESTITTLKLCGKAAMSAFPIALAKFATIIIPIYISLHLKLRTNIMLAAIWMLFGIAVLNRINTKMFYNHISARNV